MKYLSREEPCAYLRDHFCIVCWTSIDGSLMYFEEGTRKSANKMKGRSQTVTGDTATVTVYPSINDHDIIITKELALKLATAYMTGVGTRLYSLRD